MPAELQPPVTKDPSAILPYSVNWASLDGTNDGSDTDTGWLQGSSITSSTWTVSGPDDSLEATSDSNSDTVTTVVLAGGTAKKRYTVTNRIVAGNWQDERSFNVEVCQR